jgi:hypothetical protein
MGDNLNPTDTQVQAWDISTYTREPMGSLNPIQYNVIDDGHTVLTKILYLIAHYSLTVPIPFSQSQ